MSVKILPPADGWRPSTWYLVDIECFQGNPLHRALFFSGFLNDDGTPGGYSDVAALNYAEKGVDIGWQNMKSLAVVKRLFSVGEAERVKEFEDRSGGFIESLREKDAEIAALLRAVADHATVRSELAERVKSLEEDRIALVKAVGESSAVLIRQRDEAYEIVLRHEVRLQASDKEIERRKNRAQTVMEDAHGAFHEAVKGWPGVEGMHTIDECADPAAWIRHVARQRDDLAQKVKELERERWNCHECGKDHARPKGKCPDRLGDPMGRCGVNFLWKERAHISVCGRNADHGGAHSWYSDCWYCKGTAGEHALACTIYPPHKVGL